jgi:hypothetical protein
MCVHLNVYYQLTSSYVNVLQFLAKFSKRKIKKFTKICCLGKTFLKPKGQTVRWTDTKKLTVVFTEFCSQFKHGFNIYRRVGKYYLPYRQRLFQFKTHILTLIWQNFLICSFKTLIIFHSETQPFWILLGHWLVKFIITSLSCNSQNLHKY